MVEFDNKSIFVISVILAINCDDSSNKILKKQPVLPLPSMLAQPPSSPGQNTNEKMRYSIDINKTTYIVCT